MARILVIASDPVEAKLLCSLVGTAGHDPSVAFGGQHGIAVTRAALPDMVITDWALPDMAGADVCRTLDSEPETRRIPIVVLSATSEEVDRIVSFELGASDYVTRPYSQRELILRVNAILRRARHEPGNDGTVDLGRLRIDRAAYRVWVDGREVDLTLLELNLLLALYEGRSRVQTRAALLDEVWGIDASITTRTVDTHIKRLRDKLGALGEYVETVRGVGYRLAHIAPLAGS